MAVLFVTLQTMPEKELEQLILSLRAWCSEKHGRQKEPAKAVDVREDTISHWLARRKDPGLKKFFAPKAFLEKQNRK
jgi:hypothetical protein